MGNAVRKLMRRSRQANASAQWKTRRDTFFGIGLSLFARTSQTDGSRPIARNDTPSCKHRADGKELSACCMRPRRVPCERVGLEIPDPSRAFEGGRKSWDLYLPVRRQTRFPEGSTRCAETAVETIDAIIRSIKKHWSSLMRFSSNNQIFKLNERRIKSQINKLSPELKIKLLFFFPPSQIVLILVF